MATGKVAVRQILLDKQATIEGEGIEANQQGKVFSEGGQLLDEGDTLSNNNAESKNAFDGTDTLLKSEAMENAASIGLSNFIFGSLTYNATDGTKTFANILPVGARVLHATIEVKEAFASSGSSSLDLGWDGSSDAFLQDTFGTSPLTTTGHKATDIGFPSTWGPLLLSNLPIKAELTGDPLSAGQLKLYYIAVKT